MKLPYREGTWFAVPLRGGGFAVGLVARSAKRGGTILCYFFGPRLESVPKLSEIAHLTSASAIRVIRVGDLGLIRGEWPIIGQAVPWNHTSWPMPVFIRRGILSPHINWLVYFSDIDPAKRIKEEREPNDRPELSSESLFGSSAIELELSKIL
jgi:hypothetical protein